MDDNVPNSVSDYFETPNLERMANEGMRFTNAYAPAAICSPTRRSIQFGETPARQGEIDFRDRYDQRKKELLSIPRVLKSIDEEYQTAHFGKWDLRTGIFPEDLCYDESDGNTRNGNGNVFQHKSQKWTEAFINGDPKKIETLTGRALNFMERNTYNPFYLQVSHYATHVDMQTKQETFDKYDVKPKGERHNIPQFAGMLEDMDDGIGRILDKVEELGIEDHTYIFFLTDNGAVPFIAPNKEKLLHTSQYSKACRNRPLRGGKWTLYEGGIRVPFLAMGPFVEAGSQCKVPVVGWDLLPTIATLAGYEIDFPKNWDGGSFDRLLIEGDEGKVHRTQEALIFHRFSKGYPHSAIRKGDFKLLKFWDKEEVELYNLENDLGELENLATKMPKKVEELELELMNYLEEVDAEILR